MGSNVLRFPTKSCGFDGCDALSHLCSNFFGPGIGTWSFRFTQNRLPWLHRASPSATLDGMQPSLSAKPPVVNGK
jgi:hypothetical protein